MPLRTSPRYQLSTYWMSARVRDKTKAKDMQKFFMEEQRCFNGKYRWTDFFVVLNLLSEAPLINSTIMTLLLSTKVLLSKLSTHLKSRHVLNKLFEACCSLPEDDESNSIMSRILTLFKAQSGMPCISFLHITLIILWRVPGVDKMWIIH